MYFRVFKKTAFPLLSGPAPAKQTNKQTLSICLFYVYIWGVFSEEAKEAVPL